jgi:hypothetical protein
MKMSERASNAPQGGSARRVEATIMEKMPPDTWLTVTQTSRLIRADGFSWLRRIRPCI